MVPEAQILKKLNPRRLTGSYIYATANVVKGNFHVETFMALRFINALALSVV